MPYFAVIKAGKVDGVIVADAQFVKDHGAELGDKCVDVTAVAPRPGPGWTYDGATFARPAGA